MSERRLPFARPASFLIGDGDYVVEQCGVLWAAE
jgi:hypothetical protein